MVTPSTHLTSSYFPGIQGLRAVACLLVVFFHLAMLLDRTYQLPILNTFFSQGYAGVDLFFVISGFVIAHSSRSLIGQPTTFRTYWLKRLVRIYPMYWLVLLPTLAGVLLTGSSDKIPAGSVLDVFAHWTSTALLLPGHDAINGVSWSLSYELYFYGVFSLLILSPRLWVVPAGIGLGTLLMMREPVTGTFVNDFLLSPFNLEFGLGVLVWSINQRTILSTRLSLALLVASVLGVVFFQATVTNEDHLQRVLVFGSSSFLLLLGVLGLDSQDLLRVPVWLGKLGDASYMLYLIHCPTLIIANKLIKPLVLDPFSVLTLNLALVVLINWSSVYLHEHLEKPVMKSLLRRLLPVRPQVVMPTPDPVAA
ncbi:acyltransferase family protein [Spirosoma sp. KUDC1026]|uniref:acyltransferase family protein n=1 Tax=Spirosoma sp. KUDC1026 TaxID=2745947 RepID=UPI00159BEADA|nr:acyltransferase [Spirosoma sp. KUDC1026]QKZ14217.1 acyltransferase [Spirosoma sp. KUDC1026]